MDAKTCLKKMQLVGVLNVATVDEHGAPQIRCISAEHYDEDSLYFFTARGKNVAKELLTDGRVQILVYTKFKEMIRLSGKVLTLYLPSSRTSRISTPVRNGILVSALK